MVQTFSIITLFALFLAAQACCKNQNEHKIVLVWDSSCPEGTIQAEVHSERDVKSIEKLIREKVGQISRTFTFWLGHSFDSNRNVWINKYEENVNQYLTTLLPGGGEENCLRLVQSENCSSALNILPCPSSMDNDYPVICTELQQISLDLVVSTLFLHWPYLWYILAFVVNILFIVVIWKSGRFFERRQTEQLEKKNQDATACVLQMDPSSKKDTKIIGILKSQSVKVPLSTLNDSILR